MGDQQQNDIAHHAERLPTQFSSLNAVLLDKSKRIFEDLHGVIKANSMFTNVAPGLGLIPLEQNHVVPRV